MRNIIENSIIEDLVDKLKKDLKNKEGKITFNLAGISITIKTNDIVGLTLQSWFEEYLNKNNFSYLRPSNTQQFPDFYLSDTNPNENMLEVKTFNCNYTPSFDISNFDGYYNEIREKPYSLYANYLIFGYIMDDGIISIKKIWLKKVWEIAGTSKKYPLKVQAKRNKIYNIRPNTMFKNDKGIVFNNEIDFLKALFETIKLDKGESFALEWKEEFCKNYLQYYGKKISF